MNSSKPDTNNAAARRGGFAVGTLVHTADGLVPIEKIRVGERVLSHNDATGERTLKKVIRSVTHDKREVFMFGYVVGDETVARYLVVTSDQPIWLDRKGWVIVDRMDGAPSLSYLDGSEGFAYMIRKLLATEQPGIGFAYMHGMEEGPTVDFRDGGLVINAQYTHEPSAFDDYGFVQMSICHLEVEDFHSYFVGEPGILAHDGLF
jgi:hypothetical protein